MQETNLYTITIPQLKKVLTTLSALLDTMSAHADAKKTERTPAQKHEETLLTIG